MAVTDKLQHANEDLIHLCGRQIELTRERNRLNNHKQVFLAELERINAELVAVEDKLDDVNCQCNSARWRITRLRFHRFLQLAWQCLLYVYTFVTFILINVLYVLYVTLVVAANLARTILDSQIGISNLNHDKNSKCDDSLSWT